MKTLLSIAGFDPTSGAGLTKDLEIFQALGFHGLGVPTSLVIQGPKGVRSKCPVPLESFSEMLRTIKDDEIPISGIKLGVLTSSDHVKEICSFLGELNFKGPLVVDPVLRAKNGYSLLDEAGLHALKERIIPLSTTLIPNWEEAENLTDMKIRDFGDLREAALNLLSKGSKSVIIKGFFSEDGVIDFFHDGRREAFWKRKKVDFDLHGSGCTFSSIFLAFVSLGLSLEASFFEAERMMDVLLREAYRISPSGYFYSGLSQHFSRLGERFEVLRTMKRIKSELEKLNPVELVPEVQMNLCYAVRSPKGIEDVCAFPGRISVYKGRLLFSADPEFGSSSHVARALIAYMKFYPEMRSCVNLRYKKEIVEKAEKLGFRVVGFDRSSEPLEIKSVEGRSLDFLVEAVLKREKLRPDIIYDEGDFGKEAMIRLFAKDPDELLKKMEMLIQ